MVQLLNMEKKKRKIAVLGSTGSIGTQALDVISRHADRFEAYVLVANNSVELLIKQAREMVPEIVVIANKDKYDQLNKEGLTIHLIGRLQTNKVKWLEKEEFLKKRPPTPLRKRFRK